MGKLRSTRVRVYLHPSGEFQLLRPDDDGNFRIIFCKTRFLAAAIPVICDIKRGRISKQRLAEDMRNLGSNQSITY